MVCLPCKICEEPPIRRGGALLRVFRWKGLPLRLGRPVRQHDAFEDFAH